MTGRAGRADRGVLTVRVMLPPWNPRITCPSKTNKEKVAVMSAQTTTGPGPDSNPHPALDPIQAETPPEAPSPRRKRREGGFTMNELLVVLIIIGVLGLIGTGVYFLFIRDARSTVLNANIQTAAEELQSVLAIRPSLAQTANRTQLVSEMTGRTNFVWDATAWNSVAADDANTIRLQFIGNAAGASAVTHPTASAAPAVRWAVENGALRLHLRNTEGEWRCALVVLRPDASVITDETQAAEMRGVWYDGGDTQTGTLGTDAGAHDCSPIGILTTTAPAPGTAGAVAGITGGASCSTTAAAHADSCVASSAQQWVIPDAGNVDNTSTPTDGYRTFHRSPSGIDID